MYELKYRVGNDWYTKNFRTRLEAEQFRLNKTSAYVWDIKQVETQEEKLYKNHEDETVLCGM